MTIIIEKQYAKHLTRIAYEGTQLDRVPEEYEYNQDVLHQHIDSVRAFEKGDSLQVLIHATYETHNGGETISAIVDYRIYKTGSADTIIVYDLE